MKKEEYIPFGVEWEKSMMQWDKKSLINYLKEQLKKIQDLQNRFCQCNKEIKTGSTTAWHCNICGKIEQTETWLK